MTTSSKEILMRNPIFSEVKDPTLPLVIYGAGMYAQHVLNALQNVGLSVQAICVDREFLSVGAMMHDEIPIYSKDTLHTHFSAYNLIIGFYALHKAKEIAETDANSVYFFDEKTLQPITQLDILQEEMRNFFCNTPDLLEKPDLLHLYLGCKKENIVFSGYVSSSDEIEFKTPSGIKSITNSYFAIFKEIFCDKIYSSYDEYIKDEYIIFDIGANRGYSALYFAEDEKCKNIFSFEPDPVTLQLLYKNLDLNPKLKEKITVFEYGLFNKDEDIIFYKNGEGSDWANSMNLEYIQSSFSKERLSKIIESKIHVKNAGLIAKEIIKNHHLGKLTKIMKIDIEGAEYAVLQSLKDHDALKEFDMIIGECHKGMDGIMEICKEDFDLVHSIKEIKEGISIFLLMKKS
jgi:FkbM family methyltransferase